MMVMRIILQMKIMLQILGFSFLSIYRKCKKNIRNKYYDRFISKT